MKQFFGLIICCLLFASCKTMDDVSCVGTDKKVHPFKKDGVCCIYVGFSSVGCHDCHEKLNTYLDEAGFYDNDTIEIYGIIALEKDKIKNEFCENNNIQLLRIPYYNFKDIETMVRDFVI